MALNRLAKEAELCNNCFDTRICTRIVAGIRDSKVREEILAKEKFPNKTELIAFCRAKEVSKDNNKILEKGETSMKNVNQAKKPWDKNKSESKEIGRAHV